MSNAQNWFRLSTRYPDLAQFEHYSLEMAEDAVKEAGRVINFIKIVLSGKIDEN